MTETGNEKVNLSADCPNCGAKLAVDERQETAVCRYCGTSCAVSALLGESDAVRMEKIRSRAYQEVEMGRMQMEREKMQQAMAEGELQREEERRNRFRKGKFSKILLIFTVICGLLCFLAFSNGRILSGLIVLVQSALFLISWLMGMQYIKEKKQGLHILAAVAAFLLIVPYFGFYDSNGTVDRRTDEDYERAMTVLRQSIENEYDKTEQTVSDREQVNRESETAESAQTGRGSGNAEIGSADHGSETEEATSQGGDSAPTKEADTTASAGEGAEAVSAESSSQEQSGIRPEFKEAMDSYEAFFDEYIAFMEKYSGSDNAMGMLLDYADYMKRYAETMEKMEALGEEELSEEETLYYTEVEMRILRKLSEVSL